MRRIRETARGIPPPRKFFSLSAVPASQHDWHNHHSGLGQDPIKAPQTVAEPEPDVVHPVENRNFDAETVIANFFARPISENFVESAFSLPLICDFSRTAHKNGRAICINTEWLRLRCTGDLRNVPYSGLIFHPASKAWSLLQVCQRRVCSPQDRKYRTCQAGLQTCQTKSP
ncbi:unnamed protein product [Diplocarpon coronariae]